MQIIVPSDCGNSPRLAIISEFVTNWMSGAHDAAKSQLSDDALWESVGGETLQGPTAIAMQGTCEAEHLEILTVINHGRTAACDGFFVADGARTDFCHIFQFTSATKTAKIASIRTYRIASNSTR